MAISKLVGVFFCLFSYSCLAELEVAVEHATPDQVAQIHADAVADAVTSFHVAAEEHGVKVAQLGNWFAGASRHSNEEDEVPKNSGRCRTLQGVASYYNSGARTANGEKFRPGGMTAAHRTLPMGARVTVTNLANGRSQVVRINDRGPFVHGRVIDLAQGAAFSIGMYGTSAVRLTYCL